MDLADLLERLEPLCQAPLDNLTEITDILDRDIDLAEFEVVRFRVARAIGAQIEPLLDSVDPRARLQAVQAVRVTYPRAEAARVLRHMVKDADAHVRAHARHAVRQLGLDDVALPDINHPVSPWVRHITATTIGAWNPTGWSFGTFSSKYHRSSHDDVLDRYGLPRLSRPDELARLLGLEDADRLERFTRPGTGEGAPYIEFQIPKARGKGMRTISAPRHALKKMQQIILREILDKLPLGDACHGFVAGRSTVTNAEPHRGAAVVVKTDLRDFFPSVHYRRVLGLFQHYGYSYDMAGLLASLTTYRPVLPDGRVAWPGFLPQGAPTSPALANLICRRLDRRLTRLADRFGAVYTRYADDLTFSFAERPAVELGRFLWWVDQICQQEGFRENADKRRVLRPNNQQRVTGVVVNDGLHVPRAARRRFRAILANCRKHGQASQARGREDFADYLRGFAAYVKMVQPELGARWCAEVEELLARTENHPEAQS